MASERSTARFSEISASAMGSEGALRNGGSDRGLKQRRRRGSGSGSATEIDRAAVVRARLRRKLNLSQANIDTEKSLEKSCKELPRIGDSLRPARNRAGTHCSFGVRSWKEMGNKRDGYYGEVRLVDVPGWTGPNRLWIPKCSTPDELARGIDAALFFSGEEPHYFNYPKGHFDSSELKIAKETETTKNFLGRMVKKYSQKDGLLTPRTPISPPISGPASACHTAEESEDNANPHRNPTIAESSQSLQAPQPPIASAQRTADKYILRSEDLRPSRDGSIPGFGMDFNSTAMAGAQNHSPGITPWCDKFWCDETFRPWE
ncbi:unnamed protein product [Sphagnum balticum]